MDCSKTLDVLGHRNRLEQRFLISFGDDMADYEFLEFVLTRAIPRRDVKPIAKELIRRFGTVANVFYAPEDKLMEVKWVKKSTVILFRIITASLKRVCWQTLSSSNTSVLFNIDVLIDYCRAAIAYAEVEELHIIYLDAGLKVVGTDLLQKGTLTSVSIAPREVVRQALEKKAPSIILVHNHPSDNLTPSEKDLRLTEKIAQACDLMGIKLQEHIIIGKSDYYSFREHYLINS